MIARNGGARLHFEDGGRPDAEPLLLVMGLGASGRAWARMLPHLEPHARTLVVDNRGTGGSSPIVGRVTLRDLAEDLVAVLDAAEVDAAHVLGLSLGGMVAQHLALEHRDRVRSLVLGCTTPGGTLGKRPPPWRLLASGALRPVLGPIAAGDLLASALYADRTVREAPERIEQDRRLRELDATPGWTFAAQVMAAAAHDTRAQLADLAGLPVTVVHGEEDRLMPPEDARALAEAIPGARLVMIPACGHMLTTDAEHATADVVLEHLTAAAAR